MAVTEREENKENPILTGNVRRQLLILAAPLLLGNVLQQCYNIVDSLMIGRYVGVAAFAAVGVAGTVMNLMIFVINGFCAGVSVLFAAIYGTGDRQQFRREVFVAAVCGGMVTAALSGLFLTALNPLLTLLRTPEELTGYARSYLRIIGAGMMVTFGYHLCSAVLRAVGNTRWALYILFLATVSNWALDYLFVALLRGGIAGAAAATVLAQLISVAGCGMYLRRRYPELLCTRKDLVVSRELLYRTFRFGFASALQESNLYIGKMLVQGAVNGLGAVGIAAFTAASRLEGFANSFGDSGALAVSVLISQNRGAGNRARVRDGLRQGVLIHGALGILIPAILFLTAEKGVGMFLDAGWGRAVGEGAAYLKTVSCFYILCFVGSALVGYFRGTGRVHIPVIGTTINISTRVALSWLLVPRLGLAGLALATGIGWMMVVSYQILNLAVEKKRTLEEAAS